MRFPNRKKKTISIIYFYLSLSTKSPQLNDILYYVSYYIYLYLTSTNMDNSSNHFSDKLDISDSDDDDEEYQSPDVLAREIPPNSSINETADSFKDKIDLDQKIFEEHGHIVEEFYEAKLKKPRNVFKKEKMLEDDSELFNLTKK